MEFGFYQTSSQNSPARGHHPQRAGHYMPNSMLLILRNDSFTMELYYQVIYDLSNRVQDLH